MSLRIEADLLYPLIRGRDIGRYCHDTEGWHQLIPNHHYENMDNEEDFADKYPLTYSYMKNYEGILNEPCVIQTLSILPAVLRDLLRWSLQLRPVQSPLDEAARPERIPYLCCFFGQVVASKHTYCYARPQTVLCGIQLSRRGALSLQRAELPSCSHMAWGVPSRKADRYNDLRVHEHSAVREETSRMRPDCDHLDERAQTPRCELRQVVRDR